MSMELVRFQVPTTAVMMGSLIGVSRRAVSRKQAVISEECFSSIFMVESEAE
jgi:hypothetical protein